MIVADGIVVADTADVVVAEEERSSNVVVETSLNTCVVMDLSRRLKCTFLWLSSKSLG